MLESWMLHVSRHLRKSPHFFSQAILKKWDLKLEMNYLTIRSTKIRALYIFILFSVDALEHKATYPTHTIQQMQLPKTPWLQTRKTNNKIFYRSSMIEAFQKHNEKQPCCALVAAPLALASAASVPKIIIASTANFRWRC